MYFNWTLSSDPQDMQRLVRRETMQRQFTLMSAYDTIMRLIYKYHAKFVIYSKLMFFKYKWRL